MDQLDLPGFTVRNPDGESISAVAVDVVTSLGWPAAPNAPGRAPAIEDARRGDDRMRSS